MNKPRIAARLMLPALVAAAVIGGTVAPASAESALPQGQQDLGRELPIAGLLSGGGLLGGGLLGGGLLGGNLLGGGLLGG